MKSRHLDKHMPLAFAGIVCASPVGKTGTLDRRDAGRVPFQAIVSYFSCNEATVSRGSGYLEDLSKTGCKIVGPLLKVGTLGTLTIRLDDQQPPLCISGFEVCWANDQSFGVRFPKLRAEERQRLQELVLKFATLKGISEEHTAFRLA